MFGREGPISDKAQAEARAGVCVPCPRNKSGDWLDFFSAAASRVLRAALGYIKGRGLTTSRDADLHICSSCSCPLKLKVWARTNHIMSHIAPESLADLHPQCWIISENQQQNEKTH